MNAYALDRRHMLPDAVLHDMGDPVAHFNRQIVGHLNMDIDEVVEPSFPHAKRLDAKNPSRTTHRGRPRAQRGRRGDSVLARNHPNLVN